MPEDLNHWLTRLSAEEVAAPAQLEGDVLASVAARRAELQGSSRLAPYRAASVGLALALGVTAGSMAAVETAVKPRPLSTFSAQLHLAPSTLLEGRG